MTVVADEQALADAAAERIATLIEAAIAARGIAMWCLTGGRTPERLYRLLADGSRPWRARIDWTRVHVYFSDERHVPPDHPDSNFGMAARALLDHVPIPPAQIHRIHAELADPDEAARKYARELPPAFDILLLGLGEDAHIASLFPGSPLPGTDRSSAVFVPRLDAWRITLTPPVILASHTIVVLVAGETKAAAVHAALEGEDDVTTYPVQLLRRAAGRVEWWLDRAAAARLPGAPPA